MVQADQTSVLEVGSGIQKVVSVDVTRLANVQSLLSALYTHSWESEKRNVGSLFSLSPAQGVRGCS